LKSYIRASSTYEVNKEANAKYYTLAFIFLAFLFQRSTQTNSYFGYLFVGQPFLHFTVEMVKINNCWPMAIFIAVGQQLSFFSLNVGEIFFKCKRKELIVLKFCIVSHPSLKFRKTRINYSPVN